MRYSTQEDLVSGDMLAAADRTPTSEKMNVASWGIDHSSIGGREDHPSHHRLGRSTGHKQPTEKLIKTIREAARPHETERKGTVEDETFPYHPRS